MTKNDLNYSQKSCLFNARKSLKAQKMITTNGHDAENGQDPIAALAWEYFQS